MAEHQIMVKWYKHDNNVAMPSKKHLLTRYNDTCSQEGRPAPIITMLTPPLMPPGAAVCNDLEIDAMDKDDSLTCSRDRERLVMTD